MIAGPDDTARFGGPDVHFSVDLHRIDRQQVGFELVGERLGELGFPRRRRPEHGGDRQETASPSRWWGAARVTSAVRNVPGSHVPGR